MILFRIGIVQLKKIRDDPNTDSKEPLDTADSVQCFEYAVALHLPKPPILPFPDIQEKLRFLLEQCHPVPKLHQIHVSKSKANYLFDMEDYPQWGQVVCSLWIKSTANAVVTYVQELWSIENCEFYRVLPANLRNDNDNENEHPLVMAEDDEIYVSFCNEWANSVFCWVLEALHGRQGCRERGEVGGGD